MPTPDPRIMGGVIPYLELAGKVGEAAAFYARAFGAREVTRIPIPEAPERALHCHLEINGGSLMMTDWGWDAARRPSPPTSVAMQLVVGDGDLWWDRALAAGCEVVAPLMVMFWGDRYGRLRDPFGVEWAINAPAGRVP
jgi:uncharacterized glyoxalase superfamily protein PhnB